MNKVKQEQLQKLVKTLVNSGLASNPSEAMKKAKEMLNIEDKEVIDISKLPKLEEIENTTQQFDKEKTLKELMEEDAEKVYRDSKGKNN